MWQLLTALEMCMIGYEYIVNLLFHKRILVVQGFGFCYTHSSVHGLTHGCSVMNGSVA